MAARAIWKGVIRLSDIELPVKLYSAVEDQRVHFQLLSPKGSRIRQRMVTAGSRDEVPQEDIRRGYETRPGRFVILGEEELEELEPKASRDIALTHFVARELIDHRWYDRPYYLGPDGSDSATEDDYFALADALGKLEVEGVAHWVMRNKAYTGALHARAGYLMLVTLRHRGEVIDTAQLEPPTGDPPNPRELAMAEQLIAAYEDDFNPAEYRDDYRLKVRELIAAKAAGAPIKVRKIKRRRETKNLEEALAASLAQAREKKAAHA